jgi:very-long-chain (3R)-3-hydroxyacyl-CoA dehydratase
MPPKKSSAAAKGKKPAAGLTRAYLFLYNLLSLTLWATCTLRAAFLLFQQLSDETIHGFDALPSIFTDVFPLLLITQSLAGLEILHSLVGLVRAPLLTTAMQVSSRFIVVWGAMYAFGEGAADSVSDLLGPAVGAKQLSNAVAEGDGLVGLLGTTQYCDFAFLGCMFAWGITECIRYGFFAMQLGGVAVPGWWQWLRYPLSLSLFLKKKEEEEKVMLIETDTTPSSSCTPLAFPPSACLCSSAWNLPRSLCMCTTNGFWLALWRFTSQVSLNYPLFLLTEIDRFTGSYILYTHMMSQRRRVMRGKSRID